MLLPADLDLKIQSIVRRLDRGLRIAGNDVKVFMQLVVRLNRLL